MAQIGLRVGRPEDAPFMVRVHHDAIRAGAAAFYDAPVIDAWAPEPISPQTVDALAQRIARGEEPAVVATGPGGDIVGFGSIFPAASELRAVYVTPTFAREGVGSKILQRLEEMARAAGLTELTMDASLNAEAFYRAHGYAHLGSGKHVLQGGHEMACVRMRKTLA